MKYFIYTVTIVLLIITLTGCADLGTREETIPTEDRPAELILPVKVHLVDTEGYASERDAENIEALFEQVNRIWAQANIRVRITEVVYTQLSSSDYRVVLEGDISPLMARDDFASDTINGYFARSIGANGRAFPGANIFLVADITTVNDYRATAHELGHLLGLQHVPDPNRLLARGMNGELLIEQEIQTTRSNVFGSRRPVTCVSPTIPL